jgi:UDPglucose--hexose-1-phosphate uridylyltransferase
VRVVPNLYPAFERQEVVVHTPEHARSITDLSSEALWLVAEAWRSRAAAARADGFAYLHAIINEGKAAGASLPHTHSQLIWLREPPPAVSLEGAMDAVAEGELVLERAGLVALCPAVSADPYEVRVAPASRETDAFESPLLADALDIAAEVVRRLRAVEPGAPVNLWLHDGPWWHIDLVPRLRVPAGIELGAGIHVNPLSPEEAAARLRG